MPNPFKSLKDFFERLAFAGLKPDAPAGPRKSKFKALVESAENLATRGLRSDDAPLPPPVTWRKRIIIGVSILVVIGVVVALVIVLQQPAHRPESATANAPIVQIVKPGVVVEKNKELSVESIDFNKAAHPKEITGTLRNLTDRSFSSCEVSFDITTRAGAQIGGVATTVHNVPPHGSLQFRVIVPQEDAAFAMVRELRPE